VPGKGSPLLAVCVPAELLALVDEAVARSAGTRTAGPWTRSSFIHAAVEEKLAKMARSAGRERSPLPPAYIPTDTPRNREADRGFPGLPTLLRLAGALGVPVERLAEGVEDPAGDGAGPARRKLRRANEP
jgi:hypothetical protein